MILAHDSLGPTICVGEILAEVVATTVGDGFSEPIPLIGPYPSGAPAIFIVQCGRIGGAAAMVGAVGDDSFGRLNLARLKREGVDVTGVIHRPRITDRHSLCAVSSGRKSRFCFQPVDLGRRTSDLDQGH